MNDLKAEAEIVLAGSIDGLLVTNAIYAASTSSNALIPIDAKTNNPGDALTGFSKPCATIVNAFDTIWVPNCADGTVSRLDAKTKKIAATIPAPVLDAKRAVAASPDSIWVLADEKTTLARVDPEQNKIVAEIRLPISCNSLLFAESALWVTCPEENKVLRVDAHTNLVLDYIKVSPQPVALAFGEGSVWVLSKTEGKVARIDVKTRKVTATIDLKTPGIGGDLVFAEGFAWVSSPGFPITRIDPAAGKVAQQFTGAGGGSIYAGQGSIWVPNLKPNTLARFDPKRIKATLAN